MLKEAGYQLFQEGSDSSNTIAIPFSQGEINAQLDFVIDQMAKGADRLTLYKNYQKSAIKYMFIESHIPKIWYVFNAVLGNLPCELNKNVHQVYQEIEEGKTRFTSLTSD